MPDIRTTWTISHRRPLDPGEDPQSFDVIDLPRLLEAIADGEVAYTVEVLGRHLTLVPGRTREDPAPNCRGGRSEAGPSLS